MIRSQRGYAVIVTCLLLPVVLLSLGLIAFSLLKTRHSLEVKATCQQQYYDYFSTLKTEFSFIETLNTPALTLYHAQMALLPIIWLPPALKAYRAILKLRKNLEKVQNLAIKAFNTLNTALSIKTFAGIQRSLFKENRKIAQTLTHQSLATYTVNAKLQIVKRMNILFPPYDPHPNILMRQQFSVSMKHDIRPKSWINVFSIPKLNELYVCSASLGIAPNNQLRISYQL